MAVVQNGVSPKGGTSARPSGAGQWRRERVGAMVLTPPEEAHRIGAECVQAGVTRLWLYRAVRPCAS